MNGGLNVLNAIRGAITCENTSESINENISIMLQGIMFLNGLDIEQIISVIFTCTKDLNAAYPAAAAREIGIVSASLLNMAEMDVSGSLMGCIRVQVLAEMEVAQKDINHVYLKEARALRPDLVD